MMSKNEKIRALRLALDAMTAERDFEHARAIAFEAERNELLGANATIQELKNQRDGFEQVMWDGQAIVLMEELESAGWISEFWHAWALDAMHEAQTARRWAAAWKGAAKQQRFLARDHEEEAMKNVAEAWGGPEWQEELKRQQEQPLDLDTAPTTTYVYPDRNLSFPLDREEDDDPSDWM